jgi:SPP1 family phage portal protein
MELETLLEGLGDYSKLAEAIKQTKKSEYDTFKKQYDPKEHSVIKDTIKRQDKTITVTSVDSETGAVTNTQKTVFVSRLSIPLQKQIVARAAAFLCGNPVEIIAQYDENTVQENLMTVLLKTWDDNKLDYESKKLAKLMMAETECAELWYSEKASEDYWKGTPNDKPKVNARLRVRILANSLGDSLYPVFNQYGDMVAFGRGYDIVNGDKKEEHFDIYTETNFYLGKKVDNVWDVKTELNPHKKIPVIYYSQDKPEWYDVQEMIDRLETLISNHADTNDYYGSPMVLVSGKVEGFSAKGESGKVLELEAGAKAEYLTWDQSPESVRMEYNNLRSLIMDMTDTPDISFEQVKGLGNYSGIALKMLFLGAHMKASEKEETFGKAIQRRLNFLKASLAVINSDFEAAQQLVIKPRFKFFLPKNELEEIALLSNATSGEKPLMSQETAVDLNPLIEDKQTEKDRLRDEKEGEEKSPGALNRLINSDAA